MTKRWWHLQAVQGHLNAETEPSGVHVVDRPYCRSRRVAGLGWVNDMVLPDCAVGLLSSEDGNLPYTSLSLLTRRVQTTA